MTFRPVLPWLALMLCGVAAAARATDAPPSGPAAPLPASPAEPAVQRSVIEDESVRIEELRVRGEVRSIHVQPRGARAYEVLPASGGRDMAPGPGTGRAAAGQRVWSVLSF